ncbi:peptide cleavage/export ABC transporter [Maribellus comscasis]|uniref:Peptide cleavage/export ABC transporter n=1 Tax=Maribellus comscasis TaxID=2681766 RepID=A0A6I6JL62_9BACT|nr:peptidase domain-containing ABC transporter [Maribellus comscasis]QGY43595.1 peptide cleavage/export ABC transporter [Maribellus comscasis]
MTTKIKQRDITDCGAACLASVAAYYKLKLPVSKIRQWAGTDKKGTNAWGLITAAEKMGMTAKGVKASPEALSEIPLPAIAHVIVQEKLQHYVVVYKATANFVEVMDPGTGTLTKKELGVFFKEWTGVLILLSPSGEFVARNEKISNFRRFGYLLYPHRKTLYQALLGAAIFTVLGLSTSIYIQKITDYVLVNGNRNLLNLLSVAMIVLLFFQVFIGTMQTMFVLKTGQLIDAKLILGYYKHLFKLPQRFFDTMRTGEIVSRINDAVKIRIFINDTMISFIVNIFIVVFAFILMFIYSWKLALIMVLVIPFYLGVYFITNFVNKKRERKIMEQAAELESQLVESLSSVKTIKQLNSEDYANIKTETRFINLLYSTYKSGLNSIFSGNSSLFTSRIFTIVLLWVGSLFVLSQEITPGELMSFYALIGYFTGPVSSLIGMNKTYQNASIAADRLFEIMDLEQEVEEDLVDASKVLCGDICFKDVSFSYGTRTDVFEKFNLTIEEGKITAIIGESGSGKTTIASLLQKLYPVNSGAIFIGDTNIKYFSNESLRQRVGIVPQNLDLFAGTITENIAVGEFKPDMPRILEICIQLGMTDFIEKLPNGFNTFVGEHGATLSGGQKQRLAIARALYRNSNILLFDEATSSLDSKAEQYVQQTIRKLKEEGKTVVVIAHRLSTVFLADSIVLLEKGHLIERGTHDELYSQNGKYYDMWQKQIPLGLLQN